MTANCDPNTQIDITNQKIGAEIGISLITIVYIAFLVILVSYSNIEKHIIKITSKKSKPLSTTTAGPSHLPSPKTYWERLQAWLTKTFSAINTGMIVAILSAGIVLGFNSLIMTPLVNSIFPDQTISNPINIPGRNVAINPGQFLIAVIGFIFSLILLFFVVEIFYFIYEKLGPKSSEYLVLFVIFALLTFLLIWNAMQTDKILNLDDCVPIGTDITLLSFKSTGTSPKASTIHHPTIHHPTTAPTVHPLPPFGSFV